MRLQPYYVLALFCFGCVSFSLSFVLAVLFRMCFAPAVLRLRLFIHVSGVSVFSFLFTFMLSSSHMGDGGAVYALGADGAYA